MACAWRVCGQLLALGANPNAVNHNGCTPLHFLPHAAGGTGADERAAIREALCIAGADATSLKGASGLWRGVLSADEVAIAVASARAEGDDVVGDVRLPSAGSSGLVRQSTQTAFDPVVYTVLDGGKVAVDYSTLHAAATSGDEAAIAAWVARYCLHGAAEASSERVRVDTPNCASGALHYAASNGRLGAVTALLGHGAQPNRRNALGSTPMHYAAWFQHENVRDSTLCFGLE